MDQHVSVVSEPRKTRVAVIVPNPCNPDYRVIKQAEHLAKQGYEVRVFCTHRPELPTYEEHNGVEYVRLKWRVQDYVAYALGIKRKTNRYEEQMEQRERTMEKVPDRLRAYRKINDRDEK